MSKFQNSKIYKIVCNDTHEAYFGSTILSLKQRETLHKSNLKRFDRNLGKFCAAYQIIRRNNYEFILIENYPTNSRDELLFRERLYIDNNDCINKIIPIRTQPEKIDLRIKLSRNQYLKNLDKKRQYYQDNKNKIKQYNLAKYYIKKSTDIL